MCLCNQEVFGMKVTENQLTQREINSQNHFLLLYRNKNSSKTGGEKEGNTQKINITDYRVLTFS